MLAHKTVHGSHVHFANEGLEDFGNRIGRIMQEQEREEDATTVVATIATAAATVGGPAVATQAATAGDGSAGSSTAAATSSLRTSSEFITTMYGNAVDVLAELHNAHGIARLLVRTTLHG